VLTEEEKENGSHLIEFNRKSLVRVNMQAQTARDQYERTYGIATANEIRRRNNQPPIGDVGDTYLVPANMTVLDPDGLPIIRGQVAPEAQQQGPPPANEEPPADSEDRAAFVDLALHEVERLARRATGEAIRQAKQGGAAYLAFLEELPAWTHKPARLAPLLAEIARCAAVRLNHFTMAPFVAAELVANVTNHADEIVSDAIAHARRQLEAQA
jgi:hypothetical protein